VVAERAAADWAEDDLPALVRGAAPFSSVSAEDFGEVAELVRPVVNVALMAKRCGYLPGMGDHCAVEVGGIRLAYQAWGAAGAPPLVLLHALGEGGADWDGVAPAFARHWRVYAPDLRGHGRSDWPGGYSLEVMRADVLGFLDALALDRVDMIGHSMGGLVALLVAEDQPERVGRLILEDVAALLPRKRSIPARPDGELPYDWEMVLAIRRQIDDPDPAWLERLSQITAQTLVVGGGAGSHIPQDRVAELARRIHGARIQTIAAGHLIHAAEPTAFTQMALMFMRPGEAPGRSLR
jgi:3-oxoadipate enol-lactonase